MLKEGAAGGDNDDGDEWEGIPFFFVISFSL